MHKHCGKLYNPNEFENLAGMQKKKVEANYILLVRRNACGVAS